MNYLHLLPDDVIQIINKKYMMLKLLKEVKLVNKRKE